MKQMTFASAAWSAKGKTTRRERFLAEMNAVVPWERLVALIEPHYPKPGRGRRPMPLERMLRVYFMQLWFNLSDPQAEDALYDIEPMRRFAGIELAEDEVPDETTILRFRHLLEEQRLTEAIFSEVRALLSDLIERGLDADAPRLWVIDGAKALRQAITETFGETAPVQRCQEHKRHNMLDHLPGELHASVGRALRDV